MAGQCLRSNQHEIDRTPGGSGRQEGLACSGPWGHKESDTTKRLNDDKIRRFGFPNFNMTWDLNWVISGLN